MIEIAGKPNYRITRLSSVQMHYILFHAKERSISRD